MTFRFEIINGAVCIRLTAEDDRDRAHLAYITQYVAQRGGKPVEHPQQVDHVTLDVDNVLAQAAVVDFKQPEADQGSESGPSTETARTEGAAASAGESEGDGA